MTDMQDTGEPKMKKFQLKKLQSEAKKFCVSPMPKQLFAHLTTVDGVVTFMFSPIATGKELLKEAAVVAGLREHCYFGLEQKDEKGEWEWVRPDLKVLNKQLVKKGCFDFHIRLKPIFFPEDIGEEVILNKTLYLLYSEVKDAIITERIYCPPETAVVLASFAKQADQKRPTGPLLPQVILDMHDISPQEWDRRIDNCCKMHKNILPQVAMLEYMKIAQDLDMYGVSYFEMMTKNGTDVTVGIDAFGVHIYEKNDQITPKCSFSWSEIKYVYTRDKNLILKIKSIRILNLVFEAQYPTISKRAAILCFGHSKLFEKRREPEKLFIKEMRRLEREERKASRKEKDTAKKVDEFRKQREYEGDILAMMSDMKKRHEDLQRTQVMVRRLEKQLQQTKTAKEELEAKQNEVTDAMIRLEEAKRCKNIARIKLLELEVEEKQEEMNRHQTVFRAKEEEYKRLQGDIEAAWLNPNGLTISRTVQKTSGKTSASTYRTQFHNASGDLGIPHVAPLQERRTMVERDDLLYDQLSSIREDLAQFRNQERETVFDKIHDFNTKQGFDKYKNLRIIRSEKTRKRFEYINQM